MKLNYQTLSGCMMTLIGYRLFQTPLPPDLKESLTPARCEELYRLSKGHDLAHIVGGVLAELGVLSGACEKAFAKQEYLALFRYERIRYELSELRRVLSEEAIAFMPLKGSVLRDYYPDPALRTSCDIDILIHKEDLARASALLCEALQYRKGVVSTYDAAFDTPSDLHVELHFDLIVDSEVRASGLSDVWANAQRKEGTLCEYEMTGAYFYAYMTAHNAKHFCAGGCGVRPFIDLLIVKEKMPYERKELASLLEKQALTSFDASCEKLARYWFCGGEADTLILQMERYLLGGGTYGSLVNGIAVEVEKRGRFGFLFRKVFPPYSSLKREFRVLEKVPLLFPFCQVARWFRLLFSSKRRHNAWAQIQSSKNTDPTVAAMYRSLHLDA